MCVFVFSPLYYTHILISSLSLYVFVIWSASVALGSFCVLSLPVRTNVSTSVFGAHLGHAGLGDNYSRDHLFSGTMYNNKRSRKYSTTVRGGGEMEESRMRGTESWKTKWTDSSSLTHLIDL